MDRILCVYGTRPEAIKFAPVIRQLRSCDVDHAVCLTGQHRDLLDSANAGFEVEADFDLNVMTDDQSPSDVASRVLTSLGPVIDSYRPSWVVVQGDTTTVLAAALAAAYARVRVAHLEAGLRSGDRQNPFPEEINRLATTALATLHFAPTQRAASALLAEGVAAQDVAITGNTVIDALLRTRDRVHRRHDLRQTRYRQRPTILLTAHRRESFGGPLERILTTVRDLAVERAGQLQVVYPVHPNPQVRKLAERVLGSVPNVDLVDPMDYATLVATMDACKLVLTDSGGLQEEAPALGKPVLVLREVTERPEAVEVGVAELVGTDPTTIKRSVERLIDDAAHYERMAIGASPYGDGKAAERVVAALTGQEFEAFA